MTPKGKPTRDNDYYLERLRAEHPAIYADFQAGKFKKASEAFISAGLRKQRSGLDRLNSAWKKATRAEQDAFKVLIGCNVPVRPPASAPPAAASVAAASVRPAAAALKSRTLSPQLKQDILDIMTLRDLKNGDVMRELGMKPLNASLGMALRRDTQLQESLIVALHHWVRGQKTHRP